MIDKSEYFKQKLLPNDFTKISDFIENNYGIRLPSHKLSMVQTRLVKRLIASEKPTFNEYIKYVFSPGGKVELQNMIDTITTNKTDYYREIQHFEFLSEHIIGKMNNLKIWSAGCSSGEEPYSIAVHLKDNNTFCEIYASDLSSAILEKAKKGVYSERIIQPVPKHVLKKYFTKIDSDYKVKDEIKNLVKFSSINLKDNTYNLPKDFDIIFFRNVAIYFSETDQNNIFYKMSKHLKKNGYLILGLSENMFNRELPFKNLGHSIYQKTN